MAVLMNCCSLASRSAAAAGEEAEAAEEGVEGVGAREEEDDETVEAVLSCKVESLPATAEVGVGGRAAEAGAGVFGTAADVRLEEGCGLERGAACCAVALEGDDLGKKTC